jgi:DNA-directed RNA polymerase specialized sigma24 family protein
VQRVPVADIAERTGVSPQTVRRALAFHNIRQHANPARRPSRASDTPRRPHPHADLPGGIDPAWLRVEYIRKHRTLGEIAKLAGVSVTTAHKAIIAHGLARSPVRRSRNALKDAAWLRIRYLDEHATAGDIANELDVPVSAVRTALRREGVRRSA